MPLTNKGEKIIHAMREQYGEKKGTSVFYASKNAGKISGVDAADPQQIHSYMDAVRRGDAEGMQSLAKKWRR